MWNRLLELCKRRCWIAVCRDVTSYLSDKRRILDPKVSVCMLHSMSRRIRHVIFIDSICVVPINKLGE